MKKIKLSVIITHYNRFELLPYFLDYFYRHRHDDVEVILIDDGSDNFEQFQFTKQPNNFEVYRISRNRGIGYCRELGKNIARGEYLTYIDSDDILQENYLNSILLAIKDSKSDVVSFPVIEYPRGDVVRNWGSCINKVYRKQFLTDNKIIFSNERNGEDIEFNTYVLAAKPVIKMLRKPLYINSYMVEGISHNAVI